MSQVTSHASEGCFIVRFIVLGASSSVHQKQACVESGAFPLQDLSCTGARLRRRTLQRLQFPFDFVCPLLLCPSSASASCRPLLLAAHHAPTHTFAAHKVTSHASEGSFILRFIVLEASSSVHQKKACVDSGAFPFQDLSCTGARLTRRTLLRRQNPFVIWYCLLF